jgi:uncharacterized protein YyaL (SSP411 family)
MPNRLADETSPYLLQHADNPVDWYPWGQQALQKAKQEDKPILLSIGYSACHWCHVMEHESFEDEGTARLMNELFVSIKVDREERPDLDAIYMQAVQAMTGRGGWPMTVFLTPDLVPFYGGTYYPPTPRYGMPSFKQVLNGVAAAYRDRRGEVEQSAQRLLDQLSQTLAVSADRGELRVETLNAAHHALAREFDSVHGGFGDKPKFPPAMDLEFLLRIYHRTGWSKAWEMVDLTLRKMALGGVYDQLGGGFHRYSVDERWLVPHFEKMLYDNALLSRVCLHAYQTSGNGFFRRIVEETLDYVLREMTYVGARANDQQLRTGPQLPSNAAGVAGGFYSTQDADSEGEEGKFFVWTPEEVDTLLGDEDGSLFRAYFDVTEEGNFEHKNILHIDHSLEEVAARLSVTPERLSEAVERGKQILFKAREKRVKPGRDDKVLTAWNGLMLASFAEAGAVLGRPNYVQAAVRAADFILTRLRDENGRLLRSYKDGHSKFDAYLEDHAYLADGLLALYQATFDVRWLEETRALADEMLARFWDEENGGFFDTASDHADQSLIIRPKNITDNATPSGNSVAAAVLLDLAILDGPADGTGKSEVYHHTAVETLRLLGGGMARYPRAFGQALSALDAYLASTKEIVIIGDPQAAATQTLLEMIYGHYLPNKVLVVTRPDQVEGLSQRVPLLVGRTQIDGAATAYVCENYACQLPVTEPEALLNLLEAA